MPCALYGHFDKETRTFSASRSRRAKTLAERSQAWTTRAPANAMGRRHGEAIHHDAGRSEPHTAKSSKEGSRWMTANAPLAQSWITN